MNRTAPAGYWTPEGTQANGAPQDGASFGLADLARVIRDRIGTILIVALIVSGLTFVGVMSLPSQYSSSAQVMLDLRKNKVTDISSVVSDLPTDPASVQNQIQVLTSRNLAERVIAKLGLENDPEFNSGAMVSVGALINPASVPATVRDRTVDAFERHLSVQSLGLSTTFTITFTSVDAEKSARIANAVADAYVAAQIDSKVDATRQTTEWLQGRIDKLAQDNNAAESAVQEFKARNNLSESADGTPLIDQQVGAVSTQLVAARAALAEKVAQSDRIQSLIQSGHAADISQVVASPTIVALRQQEADIIRQEADLATRYGPMHPKMISVESEKKNLQDKIAMEVTRVSQSMESDVAVARAQVQSLEQSLAGVQSQATGQNLTRVKLKSLEANAASTRTTYEDFVKRLREAQDQEAMQAADASVISRAPVPTAPSSPRRTLIIGASIPAGLLLGLLIALMTEGRQQAPVRRTPLVEPMPIRARPAMPVIAEIPDLARYGASSAMAVDQLVYEPGSFFAQAMVSLEGRLANPRGVGATVLGVTAAEPGDGKNVVAIGLARSAARRGLRVVLIDGDPWSGITRMLRLNNTPTGLVEVLQGAPLSRSLVKDPLSNTLILSSAGSPHTEAALRSARMRELIAHLRRSCDLVILDTLSMQSPASAQCFAGLADAILLVAGWNGAPAQATEQAYAALTYAVGDRVGVVVAR